VNKETAPPPSRVPRELNPVLEALESIKETAPLISRAINDVSVLAYDRPVMDNAGVRSGRSDPNLDQWGSAQAKDVLRRLTDKHHGVLRLEQDLTALHSAVYGLFTGEGADETLRGTTLGEMETNPKSPNYGRWKQGESPRQQMDKVLKAAKRRAERGEYTPARTEEQPKAPKWRG
jgi:hypothetical protein